MGGTLTVTMNGTGPLGLAAYRGTSLSALNMQDCKTSSGSATVHLPTPAGADNYIQVGDMGTGGSFTLSVSFNAPLVTGQLVQGPPCQTSQVSTTAPAYMCWTNFISQGNDWLTISPVGGGSGQTIAINQGVVAGTVTSGSVPTSFVEDDPNTYQVSLYANTVLVATSAPISAVDTAPTDNIPPTTTASVWSTSTGTSAPASGWYTSTPTVTVDANDTGGSGLDRTYYGLDAPGCTPTALTACSYWVYGPGAVLTTQVTIPEGQHTLTYFSVDHAGNFESPHSLTVKVDTQAPTAQANGLLSGTSTPYRSGTWVNHAVTLQLGGIDPATAAASGSGIGTIYWDTQNGPAPSSPCSPSNPAFNHGCANSTGPLRPYQSVAVPFAEGQRTVFFFAQDNAGNLESTVHAFAVWVDTTAPVTTATGMWNGHQVGPVVTIPPDNEVQVTLNGTDNLSSAPTLGFNPGITPMASI